MKMDWQAFRVIPAHKENGDPVSETRKLIWVGEVEFKEENIVNGHVLILPKDFFPTILPFFSSSLIISITVVDSTCFELPTFSPCMDHGIHILEENLNLSMRRISDNLEEIVGGHLRRAGLLKIDEEG